MTDEQRSQTGWIGVQEWVVILAQLPPLSTRLRALAPVRVPLTGTRDFESCRVDDPMERAVMRSGGERESAGLAQPHDSSRVGVLAPAVAMPRALEGEAGRAPGVAALLMPISA